MAASTTTPVFPLAARVPFPLNREVSRPKRRRISRPAGQALEILGHAIEYLTDEFVENGGMLTSDKGALDAIQLLMAVNREIYFACPEVPTLGERMLALLGVR